MLFSGLFIHTVTRKTRPEVHHFCISRHAMILGAVTLSKVTKNRQQISRKEVRIIVDFHNVLKIISISPLNHDPGNVMLKLFKVFFPAPPQPQDKTFIFSAEQLVKFVVNVAINVAQPQVCYINSPRTQLTRSQVCVSEAAKTYLGVDITGSSLFDAIGVRSKFLGGGRGGGWGGG